MYLSLALYSLYIQWEQKKIPLWISKGLLRNNNFYFQTSKQIFGSDYKKNAAEHKAILLPVQQHNSLE